MKAKSLSNLAARVIPAVIVPALVFALGAGSVARQSVAVENNRLQLACDVCDPIEWGSEPMPLPVYEPKKPGPIPIIEPDPKAVDVALSPCLCEPKPVVGEPMPLPVYGKPKVICLACDPAF